MVLAPIVRGRKGEFRDQLEHLRSEGFTRVKVDGELRLLEDDIVLDKKFKHDLSVVVDRLIMRAGGPQAAGGLGGDRGVARRRDHRHRAGATGRRPEVRTFSERFACLHCGISMPELEPRSFSFNSPHGACPRCTGLGSQMEIDPDLVVPDPSLSIGEGAILPWSVGHDDLLRPADRGASPTATRSTSTRRGRSCRRSTQDLFLYGTEGDKIYVSYRNRMGRRRSYMTTFEGIIPNLERRYKETDSDYSREKIEEYMTMRPCPECKGARLRPESRAVKVGGARDPRVLAPVGAPGDRAGSRRSSCRTPTGRSRG